MNRKRIIDELREVRENNVFRFEQQKKLEEGISIIEKKLSDNLEEVISYIREDLVNQASYGNLRCIYRVIQINKTFLNSENCSFLDVEKITDITIVSRLVDRYSIESLNGELLRWAFLVVRKQALFDRLQKEGLEFEYSDDKGLIVYEPLEEAKRTLKQTS